MAFFRLLGQFMGRRRNLFLIRLFCALVFLCISLSCKKSELIQPVSGDLIEVEVLSVESQPLPISWRYTGKALPSSKVSVIAEVSGRVSSRKYTEGDFVEVGDLLYSIDPDSYSLALKQAHAEVKMQTISFEKADRDYRRIKKLRLVKSVSQSRLDEVEANRDFAKAALRESEVQYEVAQLNLKRTKITAPISGVVGKALLDSGDYVKEENQIMAIIQTLDPLYIEFNVAEKDYYSSGMAASEPVNVQVSSTYNKEFSAAAEINYIASEISQTTNTIKVRAAIKNERQLILPGAFLDVAIKTAANEDTILVPSSSLSRSQGEYLAFVVVEGYKVQERVVTLEGSLGGPLWQVRSGLRVGDQLITSNLNKIKVGDSVTPIRKLSRLAKSGPDA